MIAAFYVAICTFFFVSGLSKFNRDINDLDGSSFVKSKRTKLSLSGSVRILRVGGPLSNPKSFFICR
jgi:hypothetical protein